jgi:8-oxo-dGTP diphosphatase
MNIQVVCGIIENGKGLVLLAERPAGKKLAGLWEFPGGKIEAGESPEDALRRELKEELKLDVHIVRRLGKFPHTYDWAAIDLEAFVVSALNEPTATADVQVFQWLSPHQIARDKLAAADHAPLAQYLRISGLRSVKG